VRGEPIARTLEEAVVSPQAVGGSLRRSLKSAGVVDGIIGQDGQGPTLTRDLFSAKVGDCSAVDSGTRTTATIGLGAPRLSGHEPIRRSI